MSTASQKQAVKLLNGLGYSWEGNFYSGFWVAPPESDYEKGMREAMKKIAKSCGKTFSVDIGWEDLPNLVESLVSKKPNPRTKTVYEKVEIENAWVVVKYFEEGGELWTNFSENGYRRIDNAPDVLRYLYKLYKPVEKEIDWKEELVEKLGDNSILMGYNHDFVQFRRQLSHKEFVDICHLVESLTDKPE